MSDNTPCPNAWETDHGDWIWCQLPEGHEGDHRFEWEGEPASRELWCMTHDSPQSESGSGKCVEALMLPARDGCRFAWRSVLLEVEHE